MSEFSRETLLNIIETDHVQCGEASALACMALAAMDSEPHTDDELSNLLWYSQEATCHSDPNYYCEFQRLATPGLIAGIIRELQERRKAAMDSEPVAYMHDGEDGTEYNGHNEFSGGGKGIPLYRHAQQPVLLVAPDKMTAIVKDEAEYVEGWNACRAAMLNPDKARKKVRVIVLGASIGAGFDATASGNSPAQSDCCPAQNVVVPAQSPIDHGYLPECECSGCKATARICAELAGNPPVIPDGSASMLRRWLAFGRGMQNAGSQLPHNLIAETEAMLAAAQQEGK